MRWIGRLFLLLLVVAALVSGYGVLRPFWQMPTSLPAIVQALDLDTDAATVYFLSPDKWLTFALINQPAQLRLLTHAGTSPDTTREAELRYTLVYEVLDDSRAVLHRNHYTHETRLPPTLDKAGTPVPRHLYAGTDLSVANGQALNLRLEELPEASYLRVRLEPLAVPLHNVALRLYQEQRQSAREAKLEWERLNQEQRQRLSKAIIAPPALLSDRERRLLLQFYWRPTGPQDTNPPRGRLFTVEGLEPSIDPELTLQAPGLYVDRDRLGVLPIPAEGHYLIQFTPLQDKAEASQLTFHQLTERLEARRLKTIELSEGPGLVPQYFEPGLVMVHPSEPGLLDIFPSATPETSALPDPVYLRAYMVGEDGLDYRVTADESHRTPLRLDLRAYGQGWPLPVQTPLTATYRFYDARDVLIEEGELTPTLPPSAFDRATSTPFIADISQPASFYFRLSPDVSRVVVASDDAVLASAYTRPPDVPHQVRVPMDYYPWKGEEDPRPRWFLLDPWQTETPAAEGVVLHLQSRPPERNPALLAGTYSWESIEPQHGAHGARLLLPAEGVERLRPQGLPGYFRPVDTGTRNLVFETPLADHQIEPELVYLRDTSEPFRLKARLGEQTREYDLSGRRGSILLPSTESGRQEVHLAASSQGQWLMNYLYPGERGYIRRLGYRLADEPIHFTLPGRPGESRRIGARFYADMQASLPAVIHARIDAGRLASGPVTSWTQREQRYTITTDAEKLPLGHVLDSPGGNVSSGQMLLLDLGEDLPEGSLDLTFTRESGADGYLVFYEILPGEHKRIRTFTEEAR